MATAKNLDTGNDAYIDVKCSICAKKNKVANANYYCSDCRKHMCTYCLAAHNEFDEKHNVVKLLGDDKDVITEKCGKHADELITLYCHQDDELLCRKCRLEHRNCQKPRNIRKSSSELNADPELQTVPAQLKSALENISKAIEELDHHVASIQKNGNSFLEILEDYAKKLLSRIEDLRKKGKRDVESKQEDILAVTKQHRQECASTKAEIKQCLDKITKSNEFKANMFVLKKKGQKIPQKVDTLLKESKRLIEGHQFNFKTDMKIFDSLNSFNSLLENVITNVQNTSLMSPVVGANDRSVQTPVGQHGGDQVRGRVEKQSGLKAQNRSKQVKTVNIKLPDTEDSCNVSGVCHLGNGSLVIADNRNRRLKLVDPSSGKVTKHCGTDKGLRHVCCIGSQEVAVTFGSTQVHVYNADSLTRTRTIELGHDTYTIACHGELLYCVAGGWGNNILYVHGVSDGRKLRQIHLRYYGLNIFSGIAENGPGDRLYVTDWESGLLCVNTDWRQTFHLSEKDLGLSGASGVTTDHHGHVFVCGWKSNNVVKVTEDGHVVGEILSGKDGVERPLYLSYDVSRRQLCVGGESGQILMV